MSWQDGDRDSKTTKHLFVKYEGRDLELVMPPMHEEAGLDKMRCVRYLADMLIKYLPAIQAKMELEKTDTMGKKIVIYIQDETFIRKDADAAKRVLTSVYGEKPGAEAYSIVKNSREGTSYRKSGGPLVRVVS